MVNILTESVTRACLQVWLSRRTASYESHHHNNITI